MEKELYLKARDILIYNQDIQFNQLRKLMSDIIDSYNLNKYIKDVVIDNDYEIARYDIKDRKILINFDNIKNNVEKEMKETDELGNHILIKLFHYYDTIIHEIRHAKQQQMIEENDLLLSKIHNDTINNMEIYTLLHDYCPLETDANFEATKEVDNLLYYTNNIDNLVTIDKISPYIIESLLGIYFDESEIIVPAQVFYGFLCDYSIFDLVASLNLSLEQRLRYGLNISADEMRNIILEKEEGKPLKKILLTR